MTTSVIIPVFNTSGSLEDCTRSVLCNSAHIDEVILVDDGSTDGSSELCDNLARQNSCIKVVHKQNGGLSSARNAGLEVATGDYVAFLDSDDNWDGDFKALKTILEDERPDLLLFKRVDIYPDGRIKKSRDYDQAYISSHSASEVFRTLVRIGRFETSACFSIVRRKMITENNLRFVEGLISEDLQWNLELWSRIDKVCAVNMDFYRYRHRTSGSITSSYTLKHIESHDWIFSYWEKEKNSGCRDVGNCLSLLAEMWVSCAYHYCLLNRSNRKTALSIITSHAGLLEHALGPKAVRACRIRRIAGTRLTVEILSSYWRLKSFLK